MAVREDAPDTPDPVEKGFATLNTLRYVAIIHMIEVPGHLALISTVAFINYVDRIGVKAMVEKVGVPCSAMPNLFHLCDHVIPWYMILTMCIGWTTQKG